MIYRERVSDGYINANPIVRVLFQICVVALMPEGVRKIFCLSSLLIEAEFCSVVM